MRTQKEQGRAVVDVLIVLEDTYVIMNRMSEWWDFQAKYRRFNLYSLLLGVKCKMNNKLIIKEEGNSTWWFGKSLAYPDSMVWN